MGASRNLPLAYGGSTVASLKLKGIDGRAPPDVEYAAQFDSTRELPPGPNTVRTDRTPDFLDSVGSGAWPLLVRGVICLVDSVNERDRRYRGAEGNAARTPLGRIDAERT